MKTLFPLTLEAALSTEKSYWKLGDALVAETEEFGKRRLAAAAADLGQYGIDYSPARLGMFRNTAETYPRNRRIHAVAFNIYESAGSPDTLDTIMRVAKKSGAKVTQQYVRSAVSEMYEQAKEARLREKEEAQREREEAAEEEMQARRKLAKAKDSREQDAARRERERAQERKEKADERLKKAKVAPRKSDVPPPADDDIPVLVLATSLMANADKALDLAVTNKKMLGPNVADLSPRAIAGLTETALQVANAWREFADAVRSASKEKRGHLSVVND